MGIQQNDPKCVNRFLKENFKANSPPPAFDLNPTDHLAFQAKGSQTKYLNISNFSDPTTGYPNALAFF